LLLEQEILRHHRSHATAANQLRGHDGQVQQSDQEVFRARVSVGQTPGATQRCPIRASARQLSIRDPQAGVNAFDYLTVLQRHLDVIRETPTAWMPWNYQASVTMLETGVTSA
jgi:hypothetical protein